MSRPQIERLMRETLSEMFLADEQSEHYQVDSKYLDAVFPDFFSLVYQKVSNFTVTVNEYAYLCVFLFPHYMAAVYAEHKKLGSVLADTQRDLIWATMDDLVARRGLKLGNKCFRSLLDECLSNLYIHATSVDDLKRNVDEKSEEESFLRT